MDSEVAQFGLMAVGAVVSLVGAVWLVVRAWQVHWAWGLGSLLVPLVAPVFVLLHFRRSLGPVLVMLLGGALAATPTVVNLVRGPQIQTTAQTEQKEVQRDGQTVVEERLTLTGAKREEYEKLRGRKFAVVQWANADVTDADAELLRGMDSLREVDLSSTQITDTTLELLAGLPNLEVVKVKDTKATAEGVRKHLLALPKLRQLDTRGLNVPPQVLQDWKGEDKGKRYAK
jgi:hypothetical protein